MKKLKIIADILYFLVVIVFIGLIAGVIFSGSKTPFGFYLFGVKSGSMATALPVGSIAVASQASQYKEGDVISFMLEPKLGFKNSKNVVTHRIAKVTNEPGRTSYQTKGDANNTVDQQEVIPKQILGKVAFVIPYMGFVVDFGKTKAGFMFLIVFPSTLIIYSELLNIKNELRKIISKNRNKNVYRTGHFKKLVIASSFLVILVLGFTPQSALAYQTDSEIMEKHTMQAQTLVIGIRKDLDNFSPEKLLAPGDTSSQSLYFQKAGTSDLSFSQGYKFVSGDTGLCNILTLKVWYVWYGLDGQIQSSLKYDNKLKDFSLNADGLDSELSIPNGNPYFANGEYSENEVRYLYELKLPDGTSGSYSSKECRFQIASKAWVKGGEMDKGFTDSEAIEQVISSGEWALAGSQNRITAINNELEFWLNSNRESVGFMVQGTDGYENLNYHITYSANGTARSIGPSDVTIALGEDVIFRDGLTLGSCTTGTCTLDTGIGKIHIKVVLTGKGLTEKVLEGEIGY